MQTTHCNAVTHAHLQKTVLCWKVFAAAVITPQTSWHSAMLHVTLLGAGYNTWQWARQPDGVWHNSNKGNVDAVMADAQVCNIPPRMHTY
jgi:hypothetical protein